MQSKMRRTDHDLIFWALLPYRVSVEQENDHQYLRYYCLPFVACQYPRRLACVVDGSHVHAVGN